jgi:protein phosphatase
MVDLERNSAPHVAFHHGDAIALCSEGNSVQALVLADALGSEARESRAATRAAHAFLGRLLPLPADEALIARVAEALHVAHAAVVQESTTGLAVPVGVALASLILTPTRAVGLNIGNIRIYCARNGKLARFNRDHSVLSELSSHAPSPGNGFALHHMNMVTKALGTAVWSEPDVVSRQLSGDERFLLCTAGVWAAAGEERLESVMAETNDPEAAALALTRLSSTLASAAAIVARAGVGTGARAE